MTVTPKPKDFTEWLENDRHEMVLQHAVDIVWPVFVLHGWTWGSDEREKIPTRSEMAAAIRELILGVSPEGGTVSSGRLLITLERPDEDRIWELQISLVLAHD